MLETRERAAGSSFTATKVPNAATCGFMYRLILLDADDDTLCLRMMLACR